MQMQMPIFPTKTRMINPHVGFFEKDGMIIYLHNGSPIFSHDKEDLHIYRYITANLVTTGLCSPSEIARALGVSSRNIQRYAKALREKGSEWFFNRPERRGQCNKLNDEAKRYAEELIGKFYTVKDTARLLGVTEGALRYHIKNGSIKKKWKF
jgi:transposase